MLPGLAKAILGKGRGMPFDQVRVVPHNAPRAGRPAKETSNLQVVETALATGVSAAQVVVIAAEEPLEE
jgi:hypothetical protein